MPSGLLPISAERRYGNRPPAGHSGPVCADARRGPIGRGNGVDPGFPLLHDAPHELVNHVWMRSVVAAAGFECLVRVRVVVLAQHREPGNLLRKKILSIRRRDPFGGGRQPAVGCLRTRAGPRHLEDHQTLVRLDLRPLTRHGLAVNVETLRVVPGRVEEGSRNLHGQVRLSELEDGRLHGIRIPVLPVEVLAHDA